ncbi:enoyl-CoA hydratase/isomerase family protein [Curtobacterium flaccumfaciens]|uniref:enoyl-CoA hydratase/isomerase family protein n=1 Tax=Curtobacterium flaccumfaciens TaxID=2035 RepID=UPI001BDF5BC9|nr:enoyl-CoA hydratase-related protein [Curtobacterium flaccumfaciens]MBT1672829.1 enoyl-CoA hydratase/isomerase family protein [Curtobacterium flaccumfaciens pv. flaccumfaciens]
MRRQNGVKVKTWTDDSIGWIMLDRPEVLNALDDETHVLLGEAVNQHLTDPTVATIVLRGAGTASFSVGQDLKETARLIQDPLYKPTLGSQGRPGHPRLTQRTDITKPMVAMIHGLALGGGFELALACDVILCDYNARFALPETKLGMIPGAGGIFRAQMKLPSNIANAMLFAGFELDAQLALQHGLVLDICEPDELEIRTRQFAFSISERSESANASVKDLIASSRGRSIEDAFHLNSEAEQHRLRAGDWRARISKWLNRSRNQ